MVKDGLAFATASEDMDTLTFGSNYLLRGFNSKKEPIVQIELAQVLEGFEMDMDKFIDLCILCGCDYTTNIHGVGPVKAFRYMQECGTIENVIKRIEKNNDDPSKKKKYYIPDTFFYKEARQLFHYPDVNKDVDQIRHLLKWDKAEEELLKEFLVT